MQPTPTPTQKTDHTQYYREVLHRLIDIGAEIAETVHQQATQTPAATTPAPATTQQDPTIQFDRIARAIRRTINLARALDEPPKPHPASTCRATPRAMDRTAARKTIIRRVEDSIHHDVKGPRAESLREQLFDRLDAPEFESDLENLPIEHIIIDICRDLGINGIPGVDLWKRRTPRDIELLNVRAAAPPGAIPRPPKPKATPPEPGPDRQSRADYDTENILLCQHLLRTAK